MSHAKDEPDIPDIYRYLTARSNSKLSFAYDESWPLLGTSAAVKCQSRMKPLAFFLFLGSLLSADPLKCTLSNVKASPELGARVDGETLRVAWVGERGTQLRAVFGIDGAAPVVRELAVGEAVLARNLTPEFTTVSGMRRAAHGLDNEHRWDVFWDAPLTIPGGGENPGLPRKPEEIRHGSSSFNTHACEVRQEGATYWLVDLDSTNGIEVRGKRVKRLKLEDGQRFTVGSTEIAFSRELQ